MLLLHVGNHFSSFVPASIGFRCSFPSFHNSNIGIRKHRSIPLLILRIVLLRYDLSKDQTSIPWGNVSMENSSKFFPPNFVHLGSKKENPGWNYVPPFSLIAAKCRGNVIFLSDKVYTQKHPSCNDTIVIQRLVVASTVRRWEEVKIDDPWSLSQRTCCVWIIVYGINTMLITHGGIPRSRELLPRERLKMNYRWLIRHRAWNLSNSACSKEWSLIFQAEWMDIYLFFKFERDWIKDDSCKNMERLMIWSLVLDRF